MGAPRGKRNPVFNAIRNGNWKNPALSLKARQKIALSKMGNKNPKWKGGISSYSNHRAILERAMVNLNICFDCGVYSEKCQVHHIDGNKKNNNLSNLMVLCLKCNAKYHKFGYFRNTKVIIECLNCNKLVKKSPSHINRNRGNFCSRECWYEYRKKNQFYSYKEKKGVKCANCGKIIYPSPSRIKTRKNNFCSRECWWAYRKRLHIHAYK